MQSIRWRSRRAVREIDKEIHMGRRAQCQNYLGVPSTASFVEIRDGDLYHNKKTQKSASAIVKIGSGPKNVKENFLIPGGATTIQNVKSSRQKSDSNVFMGVKRKQSLDPKTKQFLQGALFSQVQFGDKWNFGDQFHYSTYRENASIGKDDQNNQ